MEIDFREEQPEKSPPGMSVNADLDSNVMSESDEHALKQSSARM
jgi:hypothetical protein